MSRYRLWLPVVFGVVATVLAGLEVYFSNAIVDTGRTWHTGAPDWPFHEPGLLLMSINLPGWVLTLPVALIFDRLMFWAHCVVAVPFAVFWWHAVGRRLDFGLVPSRWLQVEKPVALLPAIASIGLAVLSLAQAIEAVTWSSPEVSRLWSYESIPRVSFFLWCGVLAGWFGVVAIRIRDRGTGKFDVKTMVLSGLASNVLVVASLMVSEFLLRRHGDADLAIWLFSSAGILPFVHPESLSKTAIVLFYSALSNACLMALINHGFFGVS